MIDLHVTIYHATNYMSLGKSHKLFEKYFIFLMLDYRIESFLKPLQVLYFIILSL